MAECRWRQYRGMIPSEVVIPSSGVMFLPLPLVASRHCSSRRRCYSNWTLQEGKSLLYPRYWNPSHPSHLSYHPRVPCTLQHPPRRVGAEFFSFHCCRRFEGLARPDHSLVGGKRTQVVFKQNGVVSLSFLTVMVSL